ncbi:MAG: hypothetical protein MI919_32675 [Holophagales bacterium]|nr:hypothetical protein [Holophagales bacterium]
MGLTACGPAGTAPAERQLLSAVDSLTGTGAIEGFARADGPRTFRFPADHGPHPDFQTEWWYLTGHLEGAAGERFGFQWTLFRRALAARMEIRPSAWARRQLYLAHFTLSDLGARRFHSFERLSRQGPGLAGARAEPFRVWIEDWSLESTLPEPSGTAAGPEDPGRAAMGIFPLRLRSAAGDVALDLELRPRKPAVFQGQAGYSRKNSLPGGASYYYSFTRLGVRGEARVEDRRAQVEGEAWLDREWSTSVLAPEQVGWDWFSLQLDDGRDLMVYGLRRSDGAEDPYSSGTLVSVEGEARRLGKDDFDIEVLGRWRSPRSNAPYPSRWRIRVPEHGLELEVMPELDDQELDVSFRYWEGAVGVRGKSHGRPIAGRGYVELVGYAEP